MADKYYQAGWRTDGLLDPMPAPADTVRAGPTTGKYQEGWRTDRVELPDASSDPGVGGKVPTSDGWTFAKGLQDHANAPPWSLEKSSLNMLLDKHEIDEIVGRGTGPSDTVTAPPTDNGFFTGLQPYVPDPKGPVGSGINGNGYFPKAGDANLLARLIMAEGANTPQDRPALGWSIVNRVGNREFGRTLDQVAHQKNAFESVQKNKGLWPQTAKPESFTGPNARAWQQSQDTALAILSGTMPDPTGGAALFFSSDRYNPDDPKSEPPPGDFPKMLEQRRIFSSPSYPSTPDRNSGTRNYFFIEDPYRK